MHQTITKQRRIFALQNVYKYWRRRPAKVVSLIAVTVLVTVIGITLWQTSRAAGSIVAAEAEQGTITSPALAVSDPMASGGQAVRFGGAPTPTPTLTPTPAPTPAPARPTCLTQTGPLVTLRGVQSSVYKNTSAAQNLKVDARTASWTGTFVYPMTIKGGSNVCISGGTMTGTWPTSTSWEVMHGNNGFISTSPATIVEDVRSHNYGDPIRFELDARDFIVRRAYLSYARDDCIENDYLHSGLVEDSLLDGCYSAFSARTWGNSYENGSSKVWTIRGNLVRMQAMERVYNDDGNPGHDGFFKWDAAAPKLSLHNNIFRADQLPRGNNLGIPAGKLADCSNNIVVWLGSGSYPDALPSCFTITRDKAVWDNAVAKWKAAHGY